MINDDEMFLLFPTPVMKKRFTDREFTKEEFDYLTNLDCSPHAAGNNLLSHNRCILDDPIMSSIKHFILESVNHYFTKVMGVIDCSLYITQSWTTTAMSGHAHHAHSHTNSIVSGVLYIQSDEDDNLNFIADSSSHFKLNFNYSQPTLYNAPRWWIPVKPYDLLIFPSTLAHEVTQKNKGSIRRSLAFNTFVTGNIGIYDNSNFLKLL